MRCAAALAFVLALSTCARLAPARDLGQWDNADPAIAEWYRSMRQPDNPLPCCGEADAYWADDTVVEGDKVFAVITDPRPDAPLRRPHIPMGTRIEIPPNKMKRDGGNPTGHNVIFVNQAGAVFCFVTGTLL